MDDRKWRKSSRSNGNGGNNCVEVARLPGGIGLRDSKNPGPELLVETAAWRAWLEAAKRGGFDR